jgi:hypothetical protein
MATTSINSLLLLKFISAPSSITVARRRKWSIDISDDEDDSYKEMQSLLYNHYLVCSS